MKIFKLILGFVLGLALLTSCEGYKFKYTVAITYQYENDGQQYVITLDDYYSFNSTIKDIEVSYSVPGGYVNRLTITPTITGYPDRRTWTYNPKDLMYVPDRKFMVVDVKVTGGKVENGH